MGLGRWRHLVPANDDAHSFETLLDDLASVLRGELAHIHRTIYYCDDRIASLISKAGLGR